MFVPLVVHLYFSSYYVHLYFTYYYLLSIIECHVFHFQWFGDLVTPHTWQDLWLKEGMATYFMHKALSSLHPQWDHVSSVIMQIPLHIESYIQCI